MGRAAKYAIGGWIAFALTIVFWGPVVESYGDGFVVLVAALSLGFFSLCCAVTLIELALRWIHWECFFREKIGFESPGSTRDWPRMKLLQQVVDKHVKEKFCNEFARFFADENRLLKLQTFAAEEFNTVLGQTNPIASEIFRMKADYDTFYKIVISFGFNLPSPNKLYKDATDQAKEIEARVRMEKDLPPAGRTSEKTSGRRTGIRVGVGG